MQGLFSSGDAVDVLQHHLYHTLHGLAGLTGCVRRQHDVPASAELVLRVGWLVRKHVDAGASDSAVSEKLRERRLIDERAPGRVDQERTGLHRLELGADEQPLSSEIARVNRW